MRTTLTLDDDVARLVEEVTHRERRSTKEVINDALRRALTTREPLPFRVDVHRSGIRPGIDASRLNQLAEDVDDDIVRSAS